MQGPYEAGAARCERRRPAGPKRRAPIAAVTLEPVVVPTVNRYNPRLGVVYR